jgi:hypothetical protein
MHAGLILGEKREVKTGRNFERTAESARRSAPWKHTTPRNHSLRGVFNRVFPAILVPLVSPVEQCRTRTGLQIAACPTVAVQKWGKSWSV